MIAKKALFLTKRFYTNKDLINDRFGRNYFLPTGLAKLDYTVQVIAWDYRSSQSSIQTMDDVKFITIGCRGFSFFSFLLKTLFHIMTFKPKVIIGSGDSYFGFFAWFFARIINAKCFFDVYDFYPTFASNSLPAMKWLFYQALRWVDKVYCASKPLEELIKNYNAKVFFVPNAIDPNCFKPINKTDARSIVGFDQQAKYIGYFGSLSTIRGAYDLLHAFEKLLEQQPNSYLILAGKKEESIDLHKKNVIYLNVIKQVDLVYYISACDVVTLPYQDAEFTHFCNSCKTMEYIACRVPIVSTGKLRFIENYPLLKRAEEFSYFCQYADVDDLYRALCWQLENALILPLNLVVTWEELAKKLASELAS